MQRALSVIPSKIRFQFYCRGVLERISLIFNSNYKILKRYILFLLLILYAGYSYIGYLDYKKESSKSLQTTAHKLEIVINDLFNQHSLLIQYIGSQIAEHDDPDDLLYIKKILEILSTREHNANKILSWSQFDWVSSNNKMLVNQKIGVLDPSSVFLMDRDYIPKAKSTPWTLHLSPPDIARVSQTWVIPAGFGITNRNGVFLGIITMGFNVESLNNILKEALLKDSSDFSFIILDKHNNIILKSPDNVISDKSDHYKNLLNHDNSLNNFSGFLKKVIQYDTIEYSYYKKLDQYPYVILVGLDVSILKKRLFDMMFSLFIKLSFLTIVLLAIFYLYRIKYTMTARVANQAKEQLTQKTIQQFKLDIELIYQYSRVLLNYLKDELHIKIEKGKQIEMVSRIEETALNLKNFSMISFDMDYVDIEKLIKEVVIIHSYQTLIKNISLTEEIQGTLLPFYANEVGLKKILIGLISHVLESIPRGGNLKIRASTEDNKSDRFLTISFIDDGFWLSDEELDRISEKFSNKSDRDADLIYLDRETVMNLIKLHNGTYSVEQTHYKGKITTLRFPYIKHKIPTLSSKRTNHYVYH